MKALCRHVLLICFFIIPILSGCKYSHKKQITNSLSDKTLFAKAEKENEVPLNTLKSVYWGDLHMHTSLSVDAFIGGTLTNADQAYQFAKGEPIDMFNTKVKIRQPLDFCAVTDHAEMLGEMYTVQYKGAPGFNSIAARYLRSIRDDDSEFGIDTVKQQKIIKRFMKEADGELRHPRFFKGYETTRSAWQLTLEAAEEHYDPGSFTTFAGYEWTLGGGFTHMHRNIIFRDMMVPDYPLSSVELTDEEQLWNYLSSISNAGATVMAIPHNSNFSNGGLFTETMPNGQPYTKEYAQLRSEFEPIVEVHQAKGNSEVHASLWTTDEFADFENYSANEIQKNNYLRYVLEQGLVHEEHLGINPFKYGMIGSTDTHNGTPGNTEENDTFIGNHTYLDFKPEGRRNNKWALDENMKIHEVVNPGGLVAVWAEANTRGHIYDALKNKEVYATSGNRIEVRFFAGYDFNGVYGNHDEMLADAYTNGVPMGGNLNHSKDQSPEFIVWAKKDPLCANLDRIQIIKGWVEAGEIKEEIFNVALSDGRVLNDDGSVPDNGAKVNMKTGEWSTDKGAEELMTIWKDPGFNPDQRCFYYVRVLELPTASWRLWDQIRYGIEYPADADLVIQERAWSSPIWYSPNK
ncbi:MAG: DUF3604 domain-containing protein [Chitinophagales bacterium]